MSEGDKKEALVLAAMELLREDKSGTVREIAARAGVTQGLVNYYFQSRENLMELAAHRLAEEIIGQVPQLAEELDKEPEATLRAMMKGTLAYLTAHPTVSRLSILQDWRQGSVSDNMQRSIHAFDALLTPLCPDENRRFLAGHIFCASIQSFFMRGTVLQETRGLNVFDEKQQEAFVDELVSLVLAGLHTGGSDL